MEQVGVWKKLKVPEVVEKYFINFRHFSLLKEFQAWLLLCHVMISNLKCSVSRFTGFLPDDVILQ